MERKQQRTLADLLGTTPSDLLDTPMADRVSASEVLAESIDPSGSPQSFCRQIVASLEFRRYLLHGLTLGNLPPAIVCKILDHAWGKPVERIEHSGPNGDPIVTEVQRIIIRAKPVEEESKHEESVH